MISENKYSGVAIFLILAAAFALRATGLNFGLPQITHQDEPIVVHHALAYASGDLNPHFFKIPPLLSYFLFVIYGAAYAFLAVFFHVSMERFAALFFEDPSAFYLTGRFFCGALAGTASVWVLYVLAKKMFDRRTALAAAALFGLSFLHARDSHYIYVDVPMVFCLLMVFYTLEGNKSRFRPRWTLYFWAGASIAFKYIAAPILLPIVLADALERRGISGICRSVFLVGVFYLLFNPFSLLDFSFFMREIRGQAQVELAVPFFHHLRYSLFEGQGLVAVVSGICGLALMTFNKTRAPFVLFPVAYYLMSSFFSQPYERYAMPMLPFLCVSAAFFFIRISAFIHDEKKRKGLLFTLVFIAALPSLAKTVYLDYTLLKEDTRRQAGMWMEENAASGATVVLDHAFFSPKLFQTEKQLKDKLGLIDIGDPHKKEKKDRIKLLSGAVASRKSFNVYYLDFENLDHTPFIMWSPLVPAQSRAIGEIGAEYYVRYRYPGENNFFARELQKKSRLLKVFSPYRSRSKVNTEDVWANVALPFVGAEVFSRERQGPYLEIYRLELS